MLLSAVVLSDASIKVLASQYVATIVISLCDVIQNFYVTVLSFYVFYALSINHVLLLHCIKIINLFS